MAGPLGKTRVFNSRCQLLVGPTFVKCQDQQKGAGCLGIRRSPDRCAKIKGQAGG